MGLLIGVTSLENSLALSIGSEHIYSVIKVHIPLKIYVPEHKCKKLIAILLTSHK